MLAATPERAVGAAMTNKNATVKRYTAKEIRDAPSHDGVFYELDGLFVMEQDYLALQQERDQLKQIQDIDLANNNQYREQVAQLQAHIMKLQQAALEVAKMLTLALDNIQGIADGNDIPSTAIRDAGAKALTALRQAGVMP